MKKWFLLLAVVGASAGAAFFLWPRHSTPRTPLLTFFFTGDTRGRLVPCGCFTGQYGGLTRLKTALDRGGTTNTIKVDVGDAIGGPEDFNVIQYRYILQAYAGMDYDALNLGQREAQMPARTLRELKKSSPVTLLSANLLDQQTGTPVFDGFKIIRRGGSRIALVGVVDPRGLNENLGEGLAVDKMETTLSKLLPTLRDKADIFVLLAFTDETTLAKLAQEFYEFDLVLGGKVSQPSQKLVKENRSVVLFITNESRALGALRAQILGRGQLSVTEFQMLMLNDKMPEHPDVLALAGKYREEIRRTKLQVDDLTAKQDNLVPGVKLATSYAGTESCLGCHPTAAKAWEKSGHAEAFDTLVHAKADADPHCIECHTVGFGSASGYRREFGAGKLVNVGCESCHGPGSLHVKQRKSDEPVTFVFRPLGGGDCKKCHHGEFSRPFDWEQFWPKVQHGKEPKQSAAATKGRQ